MQINKKVTVGLVQIGDRFGSQYYLPYSIGLLQCYAQKHLENSHEFIFLPPIYKKIKIKKAQNVLFDASVVFFSTYIWNYKVSLEIARSIKEHKKDCIVVFGGPQVPESPEAMERFLRNYPFIDLGCYGEGEIPFLEILCNFKDRTWEKVPSIGFFTKHSNFMYISSWKRIENLDEIPSPYLEKVFDRLIEDNPKEEWSALIETNRGCPYSCAFCYWGKKKKNKIFQYSLDRVFKEVDWLSRNKIQFVFCCDGNFGIFKRDFDIAEKVVKNNRKYGYPQAFSVQNTKNSSKKIFMIQKILTDAGLQKGVNIALQSLNKDTLESINRVNISSEEYSSLQRMFTRNKIPTFSDMIIGLPMETYDSFTRGVSIVIEGGQHNRIQFINLTVLENTAVADPEYIKKYGLIVRESKVISHHTSLDDDFEISEIQNLVIGTNSMPQRDWVKTKAFCWMISLLYFNKILQIPFLLLNRICSVNYRELIEIFMASSRRYSKIYEIFKFFIEKAESIQAGGSEYVSSRKWLNLWWPADEYVFITLCQEGVLEEFYKEAEGILSDFIKDRTKDFPSELLHEAVKLNRSLIKLPMIEDDLSISLKYNIFDVYQGLLNEREVSLEKGEFNYVIDRKSDKWRGWEEWIKEVVWYGTKKGAYLYRCKKEDAVCNKINIGAHSISSFVRTNYG